MARVIIVMGVVLVAVGLGLLWMSKFPGAGRLPGDILIKKENFTFYFPLTTGILLSVILSLVFLFFNRR